MYIYIIIILYICIIYIYIYCIYIYIILYTIYIYCIYIYIVCIYLYILYTVHIVKPQRIPVFVHVSQEGHRILQVARRLGSFRKTAYHSAVSDRLVVDFEGKPAFLRGRSEVCLQF